MLTVYTALQLDNLAAIFTKQLKAQPLQNPLEAEIVVVQNHGIARWLSLNIAEQEGIAANLSFEFPAERIWALIRQLYPDIPQSLASDRAAMQWALMDLLKNDQDSQLAVLQQYMMAPDTAKQEVRRWKLAGRIADVFDQYLIYRPQMVLGWQQKQLNTAKASERWQALLWRKLCSHWQQADTETWANRATLQQKLIDALKESNPPFADLPKRVSVFGVSAMPPVYLKTLVKLSNHTNVDFYNIEVTNNAPSPLLESLGSSGKSYQTLLRQEAAEGAVNFNIATIQQDGKASNSFLQKVKDTLLHPGVKKSSASLDTTLQIHSCHSPRREVEVLYNQLLDVLDRDATMEPSDILVLTPDLETYAPQIEAIFGSSEEEVPDIPWHLAESAGQLDPVVDCFLKVLGLMESRFEVTTIIDLLYCGPLQQKIGLDRQSLHLLKRWITENRVRWGIDDTHKAAKGLPATHSFTWQSALNNMILGYAAKSSEDQLFNGIWPYAEIEGGEATALLGSFSKLMHQLFECKKQTAQKRTVEEWSNLLQKWVSLFIADKESTYAGILSLNEQLTKLKEDGSLAGFKEEVSFKIMHGSLKELLDNPSGRGQGVGGVSFSSLQMMHHIPARMIYVLGMNEDIFPRSKEAAHFDLIRQQPQPGDRSHSQDDRQLFLDVVLAAQERLYFSYIGQHIHQNMELSPSVVLQEWIDFLVNNFSIKKEQLVVSHPLQAFSKSYFDESTNTIFSYSKKNRSIAVKLKETGNTPTPFISTNLGEDAGAHKELALKELIQFFQHPARFVLQNRFGIYLNRENIIEEDREPFTLDNLDSFKLNQALLKRLLNDNNIEEYQQIARAQNMLPDGFPGEQEFQNKRKETSVFMRGLKEELSEPKEPLEIDLHVGEHRLMGRLSDLYEGGQLLYRFGRIRPKDCVRSWIQHLALQLAVSEQGNHQTTFLGWDKDKIEKIHLKPVQEAQTILKRLLLLFEKGFSENISLFTNSSYKYAEEVIRKGKDEGAALAKTSKNWKNSFAKHRSDGYNPYNILFMNSINPMETDSYRDSFKNNSIVLWQPFFNAYNKEK